MKKINMLYRDPKEGAEEEEVKDEVKEGGSDQPEAGEQAGDGQ